MSISTYSENYEVHDIVVRPPLSPFSYSQSHVNQSLITYILLTDAEKFRRSVTTWNPWSPALAELLPHRRSDQY